MGEADGIEASLRHLELVARQLREQGDVPQVLLSVDGVSRSISVADELWLIAYNLRALLDRPAPPHPGADRD